ncbi:GFA family protein [Roseovarius sp. ZX-A-9]|uniref:GFA family protein n=1 Tax=Roseovarius sp. ZX-A-9 TaxID=3014783 RepID=UPI00232C2FE7|nr:GFA family protein [Roseovarius sp. ZX-A-9]MDX1785248.1 GFA family protein [Roseovarius sp.]
MSMLGRCLCGAVQLHVARHSQEMSACHCRMCRRWAGGAMLGFLAPKDAVEVTGPVRLYVSSPLAERAFCGTCGSQLWLRGTGATEDGNLELSPGLFDDGELRLVREIYADDQPHGLAFVGDHTRVSKQQYEADWPSVDEGDEI